jgi:hypothetical protein
MPLASKVHFDSPVYQSYECTPSKQFAGFTWCSRKRDERSKRQQIKISNSILHASDGQAFYINRYMEPVVMERSAAETEVQRLSEKFSEQAKILRISETPKTPTGILASWGGVLLDPIDDAARRILASGRSPGGAIFVDFIGDFQRSARDGLPIYKLSGTAGYVWVTSFEPNRRGTLRFLAVDASAFMPESSGTQHPVPTADNNAPRDTQKLQDGRIFLDDIKRFIAERGTLAKLSEVGHEAARLQISLDAFDEAEAIRSSARLTLILEKERGFPDFIAKRKDERRDELARQTAEEVLDAKKSMLFIDRYVAKNLGAKNTTGLLRAKEHLLQLITQKEFRQLAQANAELRANLRNEGLSAEYLELTKDFLAGDAEALKTAHPQQSLADRIPEKGKILVVGAPGDLVILYNASETAPNVAKNIRGDFIFQHGKAIVCFAHPVSDPMLSRFIERRLEAAGVKSVVLVGGGCDLSSVQTATDMIVLNRGDFLAQREDRALALARLLDANAFRDFQTIRSREYEDDIRKIGALSAEIETDVERGNRDGYGILTLTDPLGVACVIAQKAEFIDGLKLLVGKERDSVAPQSQHEWRFIPTGRETAFVALQRRQCQYAVADAQVLKELMLGLRREERKFRFSPVWFNEAQVAAAAFEAGDERKQRELREAEVRRLRDDQARLAKLRQEKNESEKTAVETRLRRDNAAPARALQDRIQTIVQLGAKNASSDLTQRFPTFANWVTKRTVDQWETFEVTSETADFGTVTWKGRTLDAAVVRSVVQQKNRILGQYDRACFLFGLVDDVEFKMERELFDVTCDGSGAFVEKWKMGNTFKSKWNAP